jgi:hypothetical protein
LLGEAAMDDDGGSGRAMIDSQIVAAVPHEQRPASSVLTVLTAGREPAACVADGGEYIRQLELHMHCHGAATRSVGVLNGIGACFTDGDKQVGNRLRRGTDRRQPAAHRNADIPQRPWQRRHYQVQRTDLAAVLAVHYAHSNIIARGITTNELRHDIRTAGARGLPLTQTLEAGVDVSALDQSVGMEAEQRREGKASVVAPK